MNRPSVSDYIDHLQRIDEIQSEAFDIINQKLHWINDDDLNEDDVAIIGGNIYRVAFNFIQKDSKILISFHRLIDGKYFNIGIYCDDIRPSVVFDSNHGRNNEPELFGELFIEIKETLRTENE